MGGGGEGEGGGVVGYVLSCKLQLRDKFIWNRFGMMSVCACTPATTLLKNIWV